MEKILVVEDDADIQEVLKNYLMAEGYEVRLAEDGVEGLAAFQSWGPDLVLLDVMLPKVDGFAVLELIRKESLVPVLMVTACVTGALTGLLAKAGLQGLQAYLQAA